MAGRRKTVLDVREILRRIRLEESDRRIARDLGMSRNTVKTYRKISSDARWLEKEELMLPSTIEECLKSEEKTLVRGPVSSVEKYRDFVEEKRKQGVELKALLGSGNAGRSIPGSGPRGRGGAGGS